MALREITAQSHQFRSADILLADLAHFFIMTEMNDNGSLSFVFCRRQPVRFSVILLV